ncbi:hypothetical protein [Burkholderia multivorans]|uniref:hypothetical protein n=1 Tax=Burkholderia multivorans TaxID=87883 RepID=UPI0020192C23|nr:hypothetical protein [Burkholderia multivorans]MCL4653445.1 hypothetical protein [Burkholderia multivorans]MCL4658958.1 hypothetical protein [Burkholderia multivorans]MCO1427950.1 hypothetical protein [Burkholderia multivorans]UQN56403.1 hypothetical protein L0Y88_26805 [Burkholderia multivorans]UQN79443.1 hypothetical protein L0Z18_07335 [Burkholderia multivorans]
MHADREEAMQIERTYRRFDISATLSPLSANRAIAAVDVSTDDAERVADPGTGRCLQIRRWVEALDAAQLTVVVDACKVAIGHDADDVDDA